MDSSGVNYISEVILCITFNALFPIHTNSAYAFMNRLIHEIVGKAIDIYVIYNLHFVKPLIFYINDHSPS